MELTLDFYAQKLSGIEVMLQVYEVIDYLSVGKGRCNAARVMEDTSKVV